MYAFYRLGSQKLSMFFFHQKTQSNICFKTSGQAFKTLSQTIGLDFEVFRGNQN